MNRLRTFIFFISLTLGCSTLFAQQNQAQDTVAYKENFGIRLGADVVKLARTALDENYQGFEIKGDYRFYKKFYAAVELGNENFDFTEPYLQVNSSGSYAKIGANYNAYENWAGMQNEIYVGLRYGFSSFSQTLENYTIYYSDNYFEEDIRQIDREYTNLNSSWVELQAGIKVEIFNNLFLGAHVQLKRSFGSNQLDNFEKLYIPGFHRTYEANNIGVGWGYSVSYLIPIFKKAKTEN